MRSLAFMVSLLTAFFLVRCVGNQLTVEQERTLALFECRVHALQPYVGSMFDTAELVRDASTGKTSLLNVLTALGYSAEEVGEIAGKFGACDPVQAPQPLPGGKVL